MTVGNRARERLATGELAIGVGVRLARTIEIGKLMRGCGYDWLLIDLEHGTISLDAAAQISIAALDAGIAPIVRVPQDEFAMAARGAEAAAVMNETVLLAVMLETPTAIANADAIAAVPGIDIVMIGTNDLMMEMGIGGNPDHAEIGKAYEGMIAACRRHGKWAGMGGVHRDEAMARYIRLGAQFILTTSDLALLVAQAAQREQLIRSFK